MNNSTTDNTPRRSLMLIEDDADIRTVLAMALRGRNYDVVEFSTGEAALDSLTDATPDIVIIDAGLPGISGVETGRAIRNRSSHGPNVMILFTGSDIDVLRTESKDVAFDLFVSKPISIGNLCQQLDRLSS